MSRSCSPVQGVKSPASGTVLPNVHARAPQGSQVSAALIPPQRPPHSTAQSVHSLLAARDVPQERRGAPGDHEHGKVPQRGVAQPRARGRDDDRACQVVRHGVLAEREARPGDEADGCSVQA